MKALLRSGINLLPLVVRHWVKSVPLVASAQRWLVNQVLSGEPFLHIINAGPARGLRFEVTLPSDKAIWAGIYEPEFAKAIAQRVKPGDVCYDIGGYRGYMAGVLALAGASRVVVFEPLPENIAALQRVAQLNPGLPLQIEQVAVGSNDGQAQFKIMPDHSMGKLAGSPFQSDMPAVRVISVKLRRLDTLVFENGFAPPNLVKIDVEGAEIYVLNGAARTLREFRPRVFVEAHSTVLADRCGIKLGELGYHIQQLEPRVLRPEETRHLMAEPK